MKSGANHHNNLSEHDKHLFQSYRMYRLIGAMMFLKGLWKKPGVWNVEEFNPDPFMEQLNKQGLPWHEIIDGDLEV